MELCDAGKVLGVILQRHELYHLKIKTRVPKCIVMGVATYS